MLIKPIANITNSQIVTLSEIMYQNHVVSKKFADREDPLKWELIFSRESKEEMARRAGQTKQVFANTLVALRKKNIIKDNQLTKGFIVYPKEEFKLVFNLKLTENE